MQKISIVIPVYNEAENIDSLVRSFYKILEKLPDSEMIIAIVGMCGSGKSESANYFSSKGLKLLFLIKKSENLGGFIGA